MLFNDLIKYILVQVLSKTPMMVGVFIFPTFMSSHDYGVYSILVAIVGVVAICMSLNLHAGIGRHLFNGSIDNARFLGTAFFSLTACSILFVFIWGNIAEDIAIWLQLPKMALLLLLPVAVGVITESVLTQIMIYLRKSATLLTIIAIRCLVVILFSVALVWVLPADKYFGFLYADGAISMGFLFCVLLLLKKRSKLTFDWLYCKKLIGYSLPLIFYSFSLTMLSQSDRIMIGKMIGSSEAGVYSLSYNIGALLLLLMIPVLNAFQPRFYDRLNRNEVCHMEADANNIITLATISTIFLSLWSQHLFSGFFTSNYVHGFTLIPLITVGGLVQVYFVVWSRVLAYYGRTGTISLIVCSCAGLNVLLNLYLIPKLGYFAAAYTTIAAQFVMAILVYAVNRMLAFPVKCVPMPHVLCIVGMLIFYALHQYSLLPTSWYATLLETCFLLYLLKNPIVDFVDKISLNDRKSVSVQ